jgi:GNAT superfamily N-acetyltransferase
MRVRVARPSDVGTVSAVLSAAAAKLAERGEPLWTAAECSEAAVGAHVRQGLYYMGCHEGDTVGVFRLQLQDPVFWPEIPEGTSAYLHKLAVDPSRQGRGFAHDLLCHAVTLVRESGLEFLRLDCVAGRPKLRSVYESFGFTHHSRKQLWGAVFERFEFNVGAPDV